jgi:MFS family permease
MMRGTLPAVSALLLSVAVLLVGNGLQGTLIGVRGGLEAFTPSALGVIAAAYYLGFSCGCLSGSWLINRVGHIRTFAVLASIASASALLHSLFVTPLTWALLRIVTGVCLAGLYMVIESWLNGRVDNQRRGALLSIYMIVNFGGAAAGQQLLRVAEPSGFDLFVLSSVLISLALVPVALTTSVAPAAVVTGRLNLVALYRMSPLGVMATFGAGLSNAAFWGLAPLFGLNIGLNTGQIATLMSVIIIGGVTLQWPVGRLSDRFDRRHIIALLTAALTLASLLLYVVAERDWLWLLIAGFIFGGFSLTLYSLAVAHTNDHTGDSDLVQVSAGLLLMFGAGSVVGPLIAGFAMQAYGSRSLFVYVAIVSFLTTLFALYRMSSSP